MRRVVLLVLFSQLYISVSSQIIADHTVVDLYDDIPQQWIDSVKTKLVWVAGLSHAYGYYRGAELLEQLDPTFQVTIYYDVDPPADTDNALRLGRVRGDGEGFYTGEHGTNGFKIWLDNLNNAGNPFDYFWFGWSYQTTWFNGLGGGDDPVHRVQWAGTSNGGPDGSLRWGLNADDYPQTLNSVSMETYFAAVEDYNQYTAAEGYNTKCFFSNGVVDDNAGTELGFQRELKNQYIRDYVNSNGNSNMYFFDYSDILVHSNAGELFMADWDDEGEIRPHQQIHPENLMDYDENFNIIPAERDEISDHIGDVGTVRLAKAMWWLLARASGWEGTSGSVSTGKSIIDNSPLDDIVVYPNPGTGIFQLDSQVTIRRIRVIDYNGIYLMDLQPDPSISPVQIDLSSYPPGGYILELSLDESITTKQVILAE